ncbi:hypothetical protein BpHYR1_015442 [Brachionus plicatilis]|uniref:Uncharacterized protein n=1 Tax=Brachionus plicatilis TaxID=10195 RepID=A0A3M7PR77_BRAPC|nr:hypothetical protein BpHYR1_015442 [Brachionus plicatilis]
MDIIKKWYCDCKAGARNFNLQERNEAVLAFLICFRRLKKVTEVFYSGRCTDDMRIQLVKIF